MDVKIILFEGFLRLINIFEARFNGVEVKRLRN